MASSRPGISLSAFVRLIWTQAPSFTLQPPPPSLREILGAYRSRGDGDREMLMAMLNAKSAEDQVPTFSICWLPPPKYSSILLEDSVCRLSSSLNA